MAAGPDGCTGSGPTPRKLTYQGAQMGDTADRRRRSQKGQRQGGGGSESETMNLSARQGNSFSLNFCFLFFYTHESSEFFLYKLFLHLMRGASDLLGKRRVWYENIIVGASQGRIWFSLVLKPGLEQKGSGLTHAGDGNKWLPTPRKRRRALPRGTCLCSVTEVRRYSFPAKEVAQGPRAARARRPAPTAPCDPTQTSVAHMGPFTAACLNVVLFLKFTFFTRISTVKTFFFFLAALGLRCCTRAFSSCGERGLLFVAVCRLLIAVASLVAEHGL